MFEKYLELCTVRKLKDFADRQGLRTKRHEFTSGRIAGDKPFTRGHLYQLLSNPLYRGKIKHRDLVHDGLHDAIIPEDLWYEVQAQLDANRVTRTTRKNASNLSPLAGRVFDENGQSFTASHARKGGRLYRYYVSRDGKIRLPASELEHAVQQALKQDTVMPRQRTGTEARGHDPLASIDSLIVGQDAIELHLADADNSNPVQVSYTQRRRGIERKLVLDAQPTRRKIDRVLIRRIVRAISWLDAIKSGQSINDIAAQQDISTAYITHNLDLAFLSPRVLDAICQGLQAPHVSAYQLSKISIPVKWEHQDAVFLA